MFGLRKIALVTGSTSGIGYSIAQHFAKNGHSVVLTGRGEQKDIFREILDFKKQYHDRIAFVHGDFTNADSISALCRDVTNIHSQGVDILVNNAGFQFQCPIEKQDLQIWQTMLSVHLTAPFLLIQHFLPYMKRKGWGRIVNISAIHGIVGEANKSAFCASKAGLVGLTKTVSLEACKHGITCNAVCPSTLETQYIKEKIKELSDRKNIPEDEARSQIFSHSNPTGNPITPDQVASLVSFLCTDEAANITGAVLPIDGGFMSR